MKRWYPPCYAVLILSVSLSNAAAQYHTYAQIEPQLQAAAAAHPTLASVYDLGPSVQGRRIWAIRISDNVGVEEDEPEVRYVSTMHGDEIIGVEMSLFLIDYLLDNYDPTPPVTQVDRIVDEIDLWIVPLMNPDGYDRSPRIRYNVNGVDLNRDFPDPFTSPSNTTSGREPETAAIMNWSFGESFSLAANMHAGALVANYPFDTNATASSIYTPTDDDELFIYIAKEYSRYNLPMWNSPVFFQGITNGADWYSINGGMQDWSYLHLGCNEITLELSNPKEPSASQIPDYWDDNRESLLAFLETSLIGVRGLVTDAGTGTPVAATVTLAGRNHDVYTDPDVGDYHRMCLPGTYEIKVAASGYDSMTNSNVVVNAGDATRWDVALGPPTVLSAPNGGESLEVGMPTVVQWAASPTATYRVQYTNNAGAQNITEEDFESGSLDPEFATGGNAAWLVSGSSAQSGAFSASSGNISHNQTSWLTRTANATHISFWYRVSSETNYDFFTFSIDGETLISVSGNGSWTFFSTTLDPGQHQFRWEYSKDINTTSGSDTAWIDELTLTTDDTNWYSVGSLTAAGASTASWTPSTATSNGRVRVRVEYADGSYGDWDESDSDFTIMAGDGIPTMSQWGMVMLVLFVVLAGSLVFGRLASTARGEPS